jgi:glycine hydroxymethyltransferase
MSNDSRLFSLIRAEAKRQAETIDLIPSENIAPQAVRELVGSVLMNKYSEGYPGRRYYPGNRIIDAIEALAQTRARKAFRLGPLWRVNVQPYSGSPANIASFLGLMRLGDTMMGLELASGGHLTHGHKVNFSGQAFRSISYGLKSDGLIDYEALLKRARKEKPKVIVSGLTAYPKRIDFKRIGQIAHTVGAYHLADISHIAGLVLAGLHPSPFPHADVVTMTTHKTLRGPRGAVIFSRAPLAERIDRAVFPGIQGGPHDNVTAAIAYAFGAAAQPSFRAYQKEILKNAKELANALRHEGFTLVFGGTENHLMLIDLRPLGLTGEVAETLLESVGIIANRNSIPGDLRPLRPSGIRLGTPTVTSRGLKTADMRRIAGWMRRILCDRENPPAIRREVVSFMKKFPLQ